MHMHIFTATYIHTHVYIYMYMYKHSINKYFNRNEPVKSGWGTGSSYPRSYCSWLAHTSIYDLYEWWAVYILAGRLREWGFGG